MELDVRERTGEGPIVETTADLSTPMPDFEHEGFTFSGCILLHKLLVTGGIEEEAWKRKRSLTKLVSRSCQFSEGHTVSVSFS